MLRSPLRWIAVGDVSSSEGCDLLQERYLSLQRQVPLLYLSALCSFVGLHLATQGELLSRSTPAWVAVMMLLVRMVHWARRRSVHLTVQAIERELRITFVFAAFFSLFFSAWALYLFSDSSTDKSFILLFGSLAAVGCAYGLSSFAKAARLPLYLLGVPLGLRAVLTGELNLIGAGITLIVIVLLVARVLTVHNQDLSQLSASRSQTAAERERALEAEEAAKQEKEKATLIAGTDYLTGLPNRRAFMNRLSEELANPSRQVGALAVIDLDGFKPINDSFGHGLGDVILKLVAERFQASLRAGDLCARIGGDEFGLLFSRCPSPAQAKKIADRLCAALDQPLSVDGRDFKLAATCGVTVLTEQDQDSSQAIARADTALYKAKWHAKGTVCVFSETMDQQRARRLRIEQALRDPSAREKLDLVFQPIFDLQTGRVCALEALARWEDSELGHVSPSEFIAIAEQIGVIQEVNAQLFTKALEAACDWPDHIGLAFNLSAMQLCSSSLAPSILAQLRRSRIQPSRLEVEITETVLLVDFEAARQNLMAFRAAGVSVVLDDFGAGYASISYLQEMQFDSVKLDGSLLAQATSSSHSRRLLKGVIALCADLSAPCVAEHVETAEQLALLLELNCARAQGYFLSEPLTLEAAKILAGADAVSERIRSEGRHHPQLRLVGQRSDS
jgi:diguanylate cyclase (GGDEF)-like protein